MQVSSNKKNGSCFKCHKKLSDFPFKIILLQTLNSVILFEKKSKNTNRKKITIKLFIEEPE